MKTKSIALLILLILTFSTAKAGFWTRLWNAITSPVQPVWGTYSENGPRFEDPPLTTFDKFNGGLGNNIDKIKINIALANDTFHYKDIYAKIYNNARDNNDKNTASQAKDAAFVFMVGLKSDGSALSGTTNPTLQSFKQVYLDIINNWSNEYSKEDYDTKEEQFKRAGDNILLMQGYDYMRLAEWTGASAYKLSDSENDDCREQIFEFTYELYRHANNVTGAFGFWPIKPDNNMTLVVAAAVGMGAITLHERGTYLWAIQRRPERWANAANAYINKVMWFDSYPMGTKLSTSNLKSGGYAEGPHYYRVAFENLWPYFQSFKNFTGGAEKRYGPYYKCAMCLTGEYIDNYYADPNFLALNDWYTNIQLPNGDAPSIDDSWIGAVFPGTALDGKPDHTISQEMSSIANSLDRNLNIRADYLAKFNYKNVPLKNENYMNKTSGDLISRKQSGTSPQNIHYLHLNAERGHALNGGIPWAIGQAFLDTVDAYTIFPIPDEITWGHEHGDVGNVIIAAGDDVLAIDPALYGDPDYSNFQVNQGYQHNVITIDGEGPNAKDGATFSDLIPANGYDILRVSRKHWHRVLNIPYNLQALVNREIEATKLGEKQVYEITDVIISKDNDPMNVQFNMNGNGNADESPATFSKPASNTATWSHPCQKDHHPDDNWKMRLTLTSLILGNQNTLNTDLNNINWPKHGNNQLQYFNYEGVNNALDTASGKGNICDFHEPIAGRPIGSHTRVTNGVTLHVNETLIFKSTIEILPCLASWGTLPQQRITQNYTSHLIYGTGVDTALLNFHLSRNTSFGTSDTAINPLDIDGNAIFETDAKNIFFSYTTNPEFKSGRCVSYCNFRKARMADGRILKYHDTTYLESDRVSTAYYSLIGKNKYKAYTETDTACTISFYLADVDTGIAMKAEGFTYSYNQTTCIISIEVPVGFKEFEIELENPCLVSCFFPSTAETIDSVFDFSEGITATLGHKLDIVRPNGLLNITKGSHMIICDGYYLNNMSNLILWSGCGKDTGQISLSTCDGRATGTPYGSIGGAGSGAVPSRITVKEGAALVLDDSSFTHISNNSELHIFGSFVIKNGAKLLIGDGRSCSYATIMVYPGAYFHCEDDANLEFFKVIGDTIDRHIFFIANKPIGGGANKGIKSGIKTLLTNDSIINSSNIPVEICDLNTVTPAYGIANREWGFSNVLAPKALIKIPNDTICEGECLLIDFTASLNDAIRELEVCRIDTILGLPFTSCFGNKQLSGTTFTNGYDESDTCWSTEPHITVFPLCDFIDSVDHWYRVHIKVKNHCDLEDTQTVYFYIDSKPNAIIDLAAEACPGYETVTTYNYSTKNAARAIWHVNLLDTSQYQENDENPFYYGGDWEVYNLHYGDSFDFPGFKWVGGFKYTVNLTQFNRCGQSSSQWDTIDIQPGAFILASPATVYSDPLGPSSLQLNAYIGSATSYTWSPTTYLDDPYSLGPIATPTDTITYILTATKDNCYAYDTLFVMHNNLAFAGVDSVVCAGSEILTGPNYDAALLFAILKLQGGNDFQTLHDTYYNNDSLFFNDLSLFMITATGKNDMNSMGCTQLINYYDGFDRAQFYEQSWYITFYNMYIGQSSHADAYDYFATEISNNSTLSSYLQNNRLWDDFQCINNMLIDYYNYKQNSGTNISSTWDVYENDSWTNLPDWNNYIKTTQTINSTTTFKLTVIDNPNGVVEYDQVTYTADTVIQPWFTQLFQTDSTIYFNNISEPVSSTTEYLWIFGDGDSSTEVNPIHTFAAFDSAYKVTLSATNKCGTEIWSDTVRVDSLGIIANLFTIKTKPGMGSNNNLGNSNPYNQTVINKTNQKGITCMSFPNPFDDKTTFIYQIDFPYTKGQLVVNNTLGQSMGNFNFNSNKGVIPIQTEHYAKGMYFYTLFIDGTLVQTGKWMKE